jgi:hypothetical protein
MKGAGGTPAGLAGCLAGLARVVAGGSSRGLGLVARSLRPQGAGAAGSYSAAE